MQTPLQQGGFDHDFCGMKSLAVHCFWMVIENLVNQVWGMKAPAFPFFLVPKEEVTIPDSVLEISPNAFAHCSSLKSLTIPDSVVA